MQTIQTIRCPNCGCPGERHHLSNQQLVRTQCPSCDYLMVTCSRTGNVVEAYAPGIPAPRWVGIQDVAALAMRSSR